MLFKDKEIVFDSTNIMGILNVTPDSFSDGGKYNSIDRALIHAQTMVAEGARFIDIGGESTRPGAEEISVQEELDRVIPVIDCVARNIDVVISIDTSKPEVMTEAVHAGASMINDVKALRAPGALQVAAGLALEHNVPTCIMHMQGTPINMQHAPTYKSVVDEIIDFFRARIEHLCDAGFRYNQIILDPGFGFGKTLDHNYQILKHLVQFNQFDMPLLAGMSRKSMIGDLLGKKVDERIFGDVAVNTIAAMAGASILRVHDVKEAADAVKVVDKVCSVE